MAWRFRLAPEQNNFDFFRWQWITFGGSMLLMVLAFVTVSADAVTRDNLADAWQQALRRDPPAAVTKALSQ